MLSSLIFFIITILITVSFHEWGHYLACRLFGVRVERFSIGFGKILLKKIDKKGTEWAISAVPLGGYVKPLAEPIETDIHKNEALSQKTPFQRFIIFFAGPFFSLLLAVIIYTGINIYGQEEPIPLLETPVAGSIAHAAGIQKGDLILEINGVPVKGWNQFNARLVGPMTLGGQVNLKLLQANGESKSITLNFPTQTGNLEKVDFNKLSGIRLKSPITTIGEIIPGGPAEQAGLKAGDVILSIQGLLPNEGLNPSSLVDMIAKHPEETLVFNIERDHKLLDIPVNTIRVAVPNQKGGKDFLGRINARIQAKYATEVIKMSPVEAIFAAFSQTYMTFSQSVTSIIKMVRGEISVKNLSGPISIANYAGKTASYGVITFLKFIALITISLGVFNLIPIPGLDGGQMLTSVVEMIIRRPLSAQVQMALTVTGYTILLALMIFTFTLDIQRLSS
ncbi:RIP metalloprotease RseP [Basilea psittacipulmonis]|uniref:Zinc metalloprotease n=1 Tax=Basilea psittacipulmonis DSM 24701 TaxID=1072685 RepID=A0A077DEP8_9BURK|nr:RIP metalloprotease RseP [Basilea psittacipulmonis]AIL32636.1 hypothetical protein IX83_04335 [Basilea psittacipulmonis DSM 24701]